MPQTPFQIDPERPRLDAEPKQPERETAVSAADSGEASPPDPASGDQASGNPASGDRVTFVPHDSNGRAVSAPVRIRTNRYGELEEHEIIKLLDTIEDERARSRFRESIYISLFIWLAIAWVVFYGPRYLWHSPQLISPVDVMKERALVQLNDPRLSPNAPAPAPRAAPKLDNRTLSRLRSMEPKPTPRAPTPQPATPPPPPAQPEPLAPTPQPNLPAAPAPVTPKVTTPVPEAPTPQPATKPSFNTPGSASDAIQQAMQNSAQNRGGSAGIHSSGSGRGTQLGNGVDILSDTQGVDFQPYLQRILRLIYEQWLPLIPEEARPPLMKQGVTQIRFTINSDGTIAAMHLDGSTHDDALNRAAWGSITSVGQFPPLPKQFHGPNLELRIHYLVNRSTE